MSFSVLENEVCKISEVHNFTSIYGSSVDELVKKGIEHIMNTGKKITSRAGSAIQA